MSSSSNGARLAAITKELLVRWQQTRESWMDQKAREFEDRFMVELESTVNSSIGGITDLERILGKIRSDCE
jgi:hypothetical protein